MRLRSLFSASNAGGIRIVRRERIRISSSFSSSKVMAKFQISRDDSGAVCNELDGAVVGLDRRFIFFLNNAVF